MQDVTVMLWSPAVDLIILLEASYQMGHMPFWPWPVTSSSSPEQRSPGRLYLVFE